MTLIEKIDAIFEWLYIHSGENPDFNMLSKEFNQKGIEDGEIRDILCKLKDDNLIYCVILDDMNCKYEDRCNFLINFDGKYFKETVGSFKEKIRRQNRDTERLREASSYPLALNRLTGWIAGGTIALALIELSRMSLDYHWFSCH